MAAASSLPPFLLLVVTIGYKVAMFADDKR
jgi:hypothetical protein